ncbi:MAG: hypothetical protein A2644_03990 [Candidatus Zambryskibacteria bacterium RIFCSPHIGHO2_01_FULL_39_63]|nr:MAG: hypothetical protein A2644_03990 [Candidatus Zambryskibacteria bacterium RIFCSPHIGHO2_01_FULL_39_63]
MKLPIYTTEIEPVDIAPFALVPAFVWKLYDSGEINRDKLLLMLVLYRHVNAYDGMGRTSYEKICTWMQWSTNGKKVNIITKLMAELRDVHKLVYYPEHKGIKNFAYVMAGFKFAKNPQTKKPKWIDINRYFQTSNQKLDRVVPEVNREHQQNQPPQNQRLERQNDGSLKSMGELLDSSRFRPPYTNTD